MTSGVATPKHASNSIVTVMAAAATELALALGRHEEVLQGGAEIATTLTVRGSTARPKGRARRIGPPNQT